LGLLAQSFEIEDLSLQRRQELVEAAVTTLRWMWRTAQSSNHSSKAQLLSIAASRVLPHIIKSYQAVPDLARQIVADVLQRIGSPEASSDEASWLCRNVRPIIYADPALAARIYQAIFAYRETSQEPTQFGGAVFALQSNRAQDYSLAYYSLETAFPTFFELAPAEATGALVEAIQGEVEREHPRRDLTDRIDFTFEYLGATVLFRSDRSDFWGQGFVEENSLKLLSWWLHKIVESTKAEELSTLGLEQLFKTAAALNPYAIFWKRLLEFAKLEPLALGPVVIPLLKVADLLAAPETSVAAGDVVSAFYSKNLLESAQKVLIEDAILKVPRSRAAEKAYRSPQKIMKRLLGCIPEASFAVEAARDLLKHAREIGDVAPNEPSFKIGGVGALPYTQEDWLREQGVKTEEPENRTALSLRAPLSKFGEQHLNEVPSMAEVESIVPQLKAASEFLANTGTLDETVRIDLLTVVVEVAETILKRDDLGRDTDVVRLSREVLLLGVNQESQVSEGADDSFASPAWGPTPQIESAQGLMRYIWAWGTDDSEVFSKVEKLSSSSSPAVRFQIANNVLAIYKSAPDKFWPFAQRMVVNEKSTGVLVALFRSIGHPHLQKNAAAEVVSLFSLRWKQGFPAPRQENTIGTFLHVIAELAIVFDASAVEPLLAEVLNIEWKRSEFLSQLASSISLYVSHGLNDPSEENSAIRSRARAILMRLIPRVQVGLGEMSNTNSGEDWQKIVKELLGAIDNIIFRIYLTAGTNPQLNNSQEGQLPSSVLQTFYAEIRPVMQLILGNEEHPLKYLSPSTAQHFMELFNQFLDFDPVGIIDLAANLCSMNLFGYQFDQQAVSAMASFVEKFLADQKQYLSQPDVATKLGQILDLFIDAGWPEASRILANLDRAMA
jgi:hypothetical protein